jgi:anti-sigma regulatory factor (Ser/Thr protein kinase)
VALTHLSDRDRLLLLAHDVEGRELEDLAREHRTSAGALAAQLKRVRARLRVEYLLAMDHTEPPTGLCRPVLLALSGGDRRRQRELDVAGHLLACRYCDGLGAPLSGRAGDDATTRIAVATDADVVVARQTGRDLAVDLGFSTTDGTVIATAISEVTRNIVKFAGTGEVRIGRLVEPTRCGLVVVARDAGPGIGDIDLALCDGHSTYGGLGLGLPGCRRLMDEFVLESRPGRGTTVTMRKWRTTGRPADDEEEQDDGRGRGRAHRAAGPPGRRRRLARRQAAAAELVAHLREHRTVLRQEWVERIEQSRLLLAMTPQEVHSETTSVYDNYVEVLETGSVEALRLVRPRPVRADHPARRRDARGRRHRAAAARRAGPVAVPEVRRRPDAARPRPRRVRAGGQPDRQHGRGELRRRARAGHPPAAGRDPRAVDAGAAGARAPAHPADHRRARRRARPQLTEQLLAGIRTHRAKVVVIDTTGVPDVDESVANHLVQTVDASRLMGASVIITGSRRRSRRRW